MDGIGYVPEDREVFGGLTVEENLRLVAPDQGVDAPVVGRLFPDLVARRGQRAGTLSGGQQQMVSLARVLLRENALLLIDEPTKGLAPKLVTEVADVLAEVARTTPILLVEQNLPARAADRRPRRRPRRRQGRAPRGGGRPRRRRRPDA